MAVSDQKLLPSSNVVVQTVDMGLSVLAQSQTSRILRVLDPGHEFALLAAEQYARLYTALLDFTIGVIDAADGSLTGPEGGFVPGNGITSGDPALAAGVVDPKKVKNSAFGYAIAGVEYSKAAGETSVALPATDVATTKFGIIMFQINAAGTISGKVPGANQTYASSALALAAIPAVDSGHIRIGYVIVEAAGATWTAGTDAFSAATAAVFTDGANPIVFSTPERFYRIGDGVYYKAAGFAQAFSAAHVITALKWGVILVQIDAAGTISTKVPASPQAYDSFAEALAAKPALTAANIELGYIIINAGAANWDANTDDLTPGSGLAAVYFVEPEDIKAIAISGFSPVAHESVYSDDPEWVPSHGLKGALIFVAYTSDGAMVVTDAFLRVRYRPVPLNGESGASS